MKINVLQDNLYRAIQAARGAAATRLTMPVLNNLLLRAEGERLLVAATNLDLAITYRVPCLVEEEGSITVPARLLADFVSRLPSDGVQMQQAADRPVLNITCGGFEANINGIDAKEFPKLQDGVAGLKPVATLSGEVIRTINDQVAFCAASKDNRPILTGVCLTCEEGRSEWAATDGFRLAVQEVKQATTWQGQLVIPARALKELAKLVGDDDDVTLYVNEGATAVTFRAPDIQLTARLVDGAYPNYKQIIPAAKGATVKVETARLHHAVETAESFAHGDGSRVKFSFVPGVGGGKLVVAAGSAISGDSRTELMAEVTGEAGAVGFNVAFAKDALAAVKQPLVEIAVNGAQQAVALRPVGVSDYVQILMPMQD